MTHLNLDNIAVNSHTVNHTSLNSVIAPPVINTSKPVKSTLQHRIEYRSLHTILADNNNELSILAESVGINWQKTLPYIHSFPCSINHHGIANESKYRGKVIVYVNIYTAKNGLEYPNVTFYTHKHGNITETWSGYEAEQGRHVNLSSVVQPTKITPNQIKRAENIKETQWKKELFQKTINLFDSLPAETGTHPYMVKKFGDHAAKVSALTDIRRGADKHGQFIMYALYKAGFVQGFQKIYDRNIKGRKTNKDFIFRQKGCKKGAYHVIKATNPDSHITYVVEGLSTGLTVSLATGATVIVALDAGNISPVVKELRYENIVIAADNDCGQKQGNAGLLHAIQAAKEFNCKVVTPDTLDKADFNDVLVKEGLNAVVKHLKHKIKIERNPLEYHCQRLDYLPENRRKKVAMRAIAVGLKRVPFQYSLSEMLAKVKHHYSDIYRLQGFINNLLGKNQQVLAEFVSYDKTEFSSFDWDTHEVLQNLGIFILDWRMGLGKTNTAKELINLAAKNNLLSLYLSHRVSLVTNAAERIGADNYQDIKPYDIETVQILTASINSVLKAHIHAFGEHAHILVLDEIRQLLEFIALGTVDAKDRAILFENLRELVRITPIILCADADIDQKTIDFLKSCDRPIYRVNEPKAYVKPKKRLLYTSEKEAVTMAIEAIEEGKRVLIHTDTVASSEMFSKACQERDVKNLNINADRKGEEDQKAFLANPNIDSGYPVVITTPVITSGFSIEEEFFDKVFVICTGILPANEVVQTAARYRLATEVIIGFKDWATEYVNDHDQRRILATQGKLTDFSHWHSRCEANIKNTKALGASAVLDVFSMKGWQVERLMETKTLIDTKELSEAAAQQRETDVITANEIDNVKAEELNRQYTITYTENCEVEKHAIQQNLVIDEITSDDFKFWDKGKGVNTINNFDILMATQQQCEAFDKHQKEKGIDVALRTHAALKNIVYKELFECIGLGHIGNLFYKKNPLSTLPQMDDNPLSFQHLEIDKEGCMTFLTWCSEHSDTANLAGIKLKNINRKYAMRSVIKILSRFGFSFKRAKSNGVVTYSIELDSAVKMTSLLARREGKIGIFKAKPRLL